ncbi:MAG: ABC transporter permease [Pseudomonadota bacterium]
MSGSSVRDFMLKLPGKWLASTRDGLLQPFAALVRHRHLAKVLLRRDARVRTSGTLLGALWLLLQPALQILIFWFLFSVILGIRFPGHDFSFFHYFILGMIPWLFINEVLTRNLTVFREFGPLYQRNRFPLLLLPLVTVLFSALIYMAVYAVVVVFVEGALRALLAPTLILGIALWLLPVTYILAVISFFVRDLAQVFRFLLNFLFYLTPILYVPDLLPDVMRGLMVFNPVADMMAVIHHLLQDMPLDWGNLWRPVLLWGLLLAPSWFLFSRAEPHFREVL